MSTEYEDVLTNQPVVIDNVRTGPRPFIFSLSVPRLYSLGLLFFRARELSRLDSPARIIQNAFSRLSMSHTAFCSRIGLHESFFLLRP